MLEGQTYSETKGKILLSDSALITSDTDASLKPDAYEKLLGAAAVVLFVAARPRSLGGVTTVDMAAPRLRHVAACDHTGATPAPAR
jgi:hypothetical protein